MITQIPNILLLHEGFLENLNQRVEVWDEEKTIGDWLLDSVSRSLDITIDQSETDPQFVQESVVTAYTGFILNLKTANDVIKMTRTTKPAFDRFLKVGSTLW